MGSFEIVNRAGPDHNDQAVIFALENILDILATLRDYARELYRISGISRFNSAGVIRTTGGSILIVFYSL